MERSHGSIEPHKQHGEEKPPKAVFMAASLVIFFLTLSAASSVGLVPDYIDGSFSPASDDAVAAKPAPQEVLSMETVALSNLPELGDERAVKPARILIPSIGLDLAVQNPETRDLETLDELLKNGPARYVDSAMLGTNGGNMLIFAHSSNLPVVHNQMYKAFNRISELKAGDTVTVQGGGKNHLYMVTSVRKADATDTRIDMSKTLGTRLTLVTCDTLTSKDARFVLEASFVGSF